jgi:hypothetical protein
MNNFANTENPNETSQQQRWDELDQKFWALYQTIDEGKLHRNVRLLAVGSIPLFGILLVGVIILLFVSPPSILAWSFALFMFGLTILGFTSIRKELAVWAPEQVGNGSL